MKTPLRLEEVFEACRNATLDLAQYDQAFVQYGVDLLHCGTFGVRDEDPIIPVWLRANNELERLLVLFEKAKESPELTYIRHWPLFEAVRLDRLDVVKALIETPAFINQFRTTDRPDCLGESLELVVTESLQQAVYNDNLPMVQYLLEESPRSTQTVPDLRYCNNNSFRIGAAICSIDMIRYLASKMDQLSAEDFEYAKISVLRWAATNIYGFDSTAMPKAALLQKFETLEASSNALLKLLNDFEVPEKARKAYLRSDVCQRAAEAGLVQTLPELKRLRKTMTLRHLAATRAL